VRLTEEADMTKALEEASKEASKLPEDEQDAVDECFHEFPPSSLLIEYYNRPVVYMSRRI
jgi:hypothetical protein